VTASDNQLLTNCTVFDGVRDQPTGGAAVLVSRGRIGAVGAEGQVRAEAPDGTVERDLGGAFVMAGLVNMHTHFSLALPGEAGAAVESLSAHGMALHMAGAARRTLRAGVTTVRCVGEKDHADFALRDAIAAGTVPGPRIFTAGKALVSTGGHGHTGAETLVCDGADEFRRGTRAQIGLGADLVKVMISGGIAGRHETIDTPQLTSDEMAAVIEIAHAWGRKVTAHAGPAPIIDRAVRLGLDCVEHGYQLTRPVAELMAERGTGLVPTLIVTRCGEFFDSLGVPEWMQRRSLDAGPRHVESYRLAIDAGVTIMLGSDMPPDHETEGTTATVREIEHMGSFGLDPVAVLRAATVVPARWLGAGHDLGTVEPGRWADLIAVDGDPTRDLSALRDLWWVMKGGEVVRDDRTGVSP
jgi:imidazolonepropionase-like amidohydrolase